MKTYIIPDLHQKVSWVENFIESLNDDYDEIVFLGDYFDTHPSMFASDGYDTAMWLRYSLRQPKRIHILGNHDIQYFFPRAKELICSGWNPETNRRIRDVIMPDDWMGMKLFHFTQNFYLSHGGLHQSWASHPVLGIDNNHLTSMCNKAMDALMTGYVDRIFMAGASRGGRYPVGGITWLAFDSELTPIRGINQVVGHHFGHKVREKLMPNRKKCVSENYCIDCMCKFIGRITDGKFDYIENKWLTNS